MLFTDAGSHVPWQWCSVAFANGLEWSVNRKGRADRFNCLYRRGLINRLHWYAGALLGCAYRPAWAH